MQYIYIYIYIAFWNVTGLERKNDEFWSKLEEWNVIILMEM